MVFSLGGIAIFSLLLLWALIPAEKPVDFLDRIDNSEGTYVQSKEFGELKLNMKYKSPAYQATAQLVRSKAKQTNNYDDLIAEYSKSANYSLRLENKEGGALVKGLANSSNGYQELIHYLSFGIQDDLFLCTASDTLKCAFVHFERNYDLAPFTNIEMGFNINHLQPALLDQKEWSVLFNADRFGLGPLFFHYETTEVNEQPSFTF